MQHQVRRNALCYRYGPISLLHVVTSDLLYGVSAAAGENSMDKTDIKKLKESGVFGPLTFWVTDIKNLEESGSQASGVSRAATLDRDIATSYLPAVHQNCQEVLHEGVWVGQPTQPGIELPGGSKCSSSLLSQLGPADRDVCHWYTGKRAASAVAYL